MAIRIRTIADDIYEEIQRKGKVKLIELVRKFRIPFYILDNILRILERNGLIKIEFPTNPWKDIFVYDIKVWEIEKLKYGKRRKEGTR